jgi:exodeoxyribonuclease VII small subunit
MTRKSPVESTPPPASYEAAMAELEQLVARMEGGQLPLDQVLASYRRGAELLDYCRNALKAVEEQVKLFDDGALTPWTAT